MKVLADLEAIDAINATISEAMKTLDHRSVVALAVLKQSIELFPEDKEKEKQLLAANNPPAPAPPTV